MTNLENLKKLAENLGADASGAETNAEAIGVVAEAAAEINDKMRTAESSIPPYAFYGRTDLTKFDHAATDILAIGMAAFWGCTNIASLMLVKAKVIGDFAFYGCKAMANAAMYSAIELGASSFSWCENLTKADAYSVKTIGNSCFSFCSKFATFNGSSVEEIGWSAFESCSTLATFPCTNVKSIGGDCFKGTAITVLDFPKLERVGEAAFSSCSGLTAVIIRNTAKIVDVYVNQGVTFSNKNLAASTPIESGTGYIYVPKALIQQYKTAEYWKVYANQYRALEDYTVDGTTTGTLDESKI